MVCLLSQKREMRLMALQRREKIAASVNTTQAARSLELNFLNHFKPTQNNFVAVYWPFRQEIDVIPLLRQLDAMGCPCLLPNVINHKEPLEFRKWKPGDILTVSRFGTFEPPLHHSVATPDLMITPLLAFDTAGYRLGFGGGYYDRTLAALRASSGIYAIGAAFEGQEVGNVPHDELDQRLDAIVTDKRVIQINKVRA